MGIKARLRDGKIEEFASSELARRTKRSPYQPIALRSHTQLSMAVDRNSPTYTSRSAGCKIGEVINIAGIGASTLLAQKPWGCHGLERSNPRVVVGGTYSAGKGSHNSGPSSKRHVGVVNGDSVQQGLTSP